MADDLDLRKRRGAPKPGWEGMPEFIGAKELRAAGATDVEVRLWLTFTVAMDRARDADVLADASLRMWRSDPWAFDPDLILARGERALSDLLRTRKVSQKHSQDAPAWRRIAQSLSQSGRAPTVRRAVYEGADDARELLRAIDAKDQDEGSLFPLLRGPKIGRLWIRELVYPGRATLNHLDAIAVAVDVQVRKVTEYLGVTDTGDLDLTVAREVIQRVWKADVEASGAAGPEAIQNTSAALDPALWFFAKWGCTHCQEDGERVRISPICAECRFPARSGARRDVGD